jgi:hypothetical protein
VILIRGECGSGKSAALRALEVAPPAGFRAAYVPVPTLDFSGIARWCLDRLGIESQQEPAAALREAAKRQRIALLIDDADLLPLDAALALRHLEREAAGNVVVVAACRSDGPANEPIVALGPTAGAIVLEAGKSEEAAAAIRAALAPAARHEAATTARKAAHPAPAPAAARAQASAASVRPALAQPIASPPADAPAPRPIPASSAQAAPAGRSVPLSIALAMAFAAFLVPVAFGAGIWIGGRPRAGLAAAASEPLATPSVSAAPPELKAEAPEPLVSRELPRVATPSKIVASSEAALAPEREIVAEPARRVTVARARSEAPTPARAAPRPPLVRTAPVAPSRAPQPSPKAREDAEWGAPVLISVEPASDAP